MHFQISLRRENRKRDNWVIRKVLEEFLEFFLANGFALSDAEYKFRNTEFNKMVKQIYFWLRILQATRQISWERRFCRMIDSFILLVYASFTVSKILQRLLACLNFTLGSGDLFF